MNSNSYDVGVVGLGHVGLPLAVAMAGAGLKTFGVDTAPEVVDLADRGRPHFEEAGLEDAMLRAALSGRLKAAAAFPANVCCDAYVIAVGTPLGPEGAARTDMVEAAARAIAANMPEGALVVLRSTVKVGVARNVVAPILAASGKRFQIAMCPERALQGRALEEIAMLPQIVGADDEATRRRAGALFGLLTDMIVPVSSLESAEIVKLVDNTYRDVRSAFANEVARLCDAVGVNGREVIAAGKRGYERTAAPMPGPVGGACLETDPHVFMESGRAFGLDLEVARAGRRVNARQAEETARFIVEEMARREMPPDAPVAILGMAFKGRPETDDLRGSMSLKVLDAIRAARPDAPIRAYDPAIEPDVLAARLPGVKVAAHARAAVRGAAVAIIANNHPEFARRTPQDLTRSMASGGFVYDYWNHFSDRAAPDYFAVGATRRPATEPVGTPAEIVRLFRAIG